MNLADSIFIFGLALIIFGPKKLPEIGRQIGKIMLEFRRASNEFKMQIEEELRSAEQADRQKQLAASEAKNSIQPIDAAGTSSESLTVRPPSTGITESTESPYQPVSGSYEGSDETTEPTTSEPDSADLSTADNAIQPVDTSAASSSESLTVQPPSTGTAESTESPYQPVSESYEGSDETTEPTASELDSADLSTAGNTTQPVDASAAPSSESLTLQPSSTGTTESAAHPYQPVSGSDETTEPTASAPAAGDLKIAETVPDVPGPESYAADEHADLQEQTTNHHG